MNAVSYLVSRKSTNTSKISAGLFLGSLLIWTNYSFADWFKAQAFVTTNSTMNVISIIFMSLACLAVFASVVGVSVGLPVRCATSLSGTLDSMIRNRVLDELTCTGLGSRQVFNELLRFQLKNLFLTMTPTLILWAFISGDPELAAGMGMCMVGLWAFLSAGLCLQIWKLSVGRRGGLFLVAPVTFLFGPVFMLPALPGPPLVRVAGGLAYLFVMSYILAQRALESRGEFRGVTSRLRKVFALKRKQAQLSENAIVARQQAVGIEVGDIASVLIFSFFMLGAMVCGLDEGSAWPTLTVLLICGCFAAYRAASKLSQSLTQEMEGSTLEILRSTPLGSERFLDGWLTLTLRPLYRELGLYCTAAFAYTLTTFPQEIWQGSFVFVAVVTLALPLLGALFGASIAGQLKSRTEVAGQLSYTVVLVGFLSFPQIVAVGASGNVWVQAVLSAVSVYIACWLLRTGATKSLNRVFLPQK